MKPDYAVSREPHATCLNCGAQLTGAFCAECGQRDVPAYPSLRELVTEALAEFSGWDGRLASTVRELIRRPGMLTCEFLLGRRARYISPLRVYLAASVLYFLLAAASPNVRLGTGRGTGLSIEATRSGHTQSSASTPIASGVENPSPNEPITGAEKEAALKDIAGAPKVMQPFLRRAVTDPDAFKRDLIDSMPRMFFLLLPVFAGIVALFYRGRKYPEHLYFAIHLHAFVFLALAVAELMKFTRSAALVTVAGAAAVIWIPIYAVLAFRRVYDGSLGTTLAKALAIGAIYFVAFGLGLFILVLWVSVAA